MSDRFTRLYTAPTDLYAENSPVIISAGALLKDNMTDEMIAQLKFKNILGKKILALKVLVHPLDILGEALGTSIEKTYLDLSVSQDVEFGQKDAIFLPDPSVRAFTAEVVSVIFEDKTSWNSEGANWEQLPAPTPIAVNLQDNQLIKQWKINFGKTAEYVPGHYKNLWRCTCGHWNVSGVDLRCRSCFAEHSKLFSCDYEGLRLAKEKRVQRETEILKQKKAEEIAYFKRAKRFTVALIIFLLLVAAGFAFYFLYPFKSQSVLEEGEPLSDDIIQTNSSTSDKVEDTATLPVAVSNDDIGVGDLLCFGMYEQDHNPDNGGEPIEWLVLDRKENSIMLLSKYALASKQYHEKLETTNWKDCDLRTWLNHYFYSVAFSTAEQKSILDTVVDNSASQNNPIWTQTTCANTVDKVYLLSYREVMSYFNADASRKCGPTASIRPESNNRIIQDENHIFWWLRSPGKSTQDAAFVNVMGTVYYGDISRDVCVRPVIWVDLGEAVFSEYVKAPDLENPYKLSVFNPNLRVAQKTALPSSANNSSTATTDNVSRDKSLGTDNSYHSCEAGNCSKQGTRAIIGLSGKTEYYCEQHYKEMRDIVGSLFGSTGSYSSSSKASGTSGASTGEKNALRSAQSYLSAMGFSYSRLIEQLEFEGYSHAEAKYAADNCGANWKEQAARVAKSYLNAMSFSRSGLIEQLQFEGFTYNQAVYGVEKNGY